MVKWKWITWLLMIVSFSIKLHAQEKPIKFKNITSSSGLSSSNAWNVAQDNKGFIWIGTYDGLNMYNGYEFKTYRNLPTDSTSINGNFITSLFFDSKNRLWAGTPFGINLYNVEQDIFSHLNPDIDPESRNTTIFWIKEDKDQTIWFGTASGLNYFDEKSQKVKEYVLPAEIGSSVAVSAFVQDRNNNLWIGTKTGLYRFTPTSNKIITYKQDNDTFRSISNNVINELLEDINGNIWIGTEDGLNKYDAESRSIEIFKNDPKDDKSIGYNIVRSLSEDASGNIWIGTSEGGVSKWEVSTNTFTNFFRESKNPYSLADNSIRNIFFDKMGGMWIATFRGVSFSDHYQLQFDRLEHKEYNPNSLTDDFVTALYKDAENQIWIGNRNGISYYDPSLDSFSHYGHDPFDKNTLSDGAILNFTEDKNGNLWTCSHLGLIDIFNKESKTVRRFKSSSKPGSIKPRSNYVLGTKDGNIWVSYMKGISLYDFKNDLFHHYAIPKDLEGGQISFLYEDSMENLMVVCGGTIFLFDRKKMEFETLGLIPENLYPLIINDIFEDKNQNLWIATAYKGLLKMNLQKETVKVFEENHFSNIYIRGILQDDENNLWLSSNNGLYRFNPETEDIKLFDKYDGLQNTEFTSRACIATKNGKMYFGGHKGISVFTPANILKNPTAPNVVITKFELFNKKVPVGEDSPLKKSINETDYIELSYKETMLSFEFVALNFNTPEKNQYAYKMEGFDKDWNYSGNRRHATYTNLPPGKTYTFKVKASNNDGVWNHAGSRVQIYIHPPFWSTWWFKLILILLLTTLLYLFYRWRTRQHYQQRRKLEKMVKERTEEVEAQKDILSSHAENLEKANEEIKLKSKKIKRQANKLKVIDHLKSEFLANISHEFRTPLTLILVPLEEMISATTAEADNKAQLSVMNRNAKRLLQLINQLLDLSKLENDSIPIKLSQNNIISFIKSLKTSFEPLAQKHRIDYQFHSVTDTLYTVFDEDKLEKIIYNLISNAFKFTGEEGSITISIFPVELTDGKQQGQKSQTSDFLKITVSDTGMGISQEHLPYIFDRFYQAAPSLVRKSDGAGIGLALTKELVLLLGGQIKVESEPGQGTCFTMLLPVLKDEQPITTVIDEDKAITKVQENFKEPAAVLLPTEDLLELEHAPLLLVVEDNKDLRQQIRRIFSDQFRVEEAKDGIEGWEKAIEKFPDLIISDVMMPGKDGFALCHQLKNDVSTSHIPTILLSARIDGEERGLSIGADDYITKPFNAKTLMLKVKNLLETRQKFREAICRNLGVDMTSASKDSENINTQDQQFIEQATKIALTYLTEVKFEMETFYRELGMSRTLVYKKIKSLTGLGPNEFIRQIRLNKASQLLQEESLTVAEVMFKVGFNHRSYFIKCFKNQFGHLPSEHAASRTVNSK